MHKPNPCCVRPLEVVACVSPGVLAHIQAPALSGVTCLAVQGQADLGVHGSLQRCSSCCMSYQAAQLSRVVCLSCWCSQRWLGIRQPVSTLLRRGKHARSHLCCKVLGSASVAEQLAMLLSACTAAVLQNGRLSAAGLWRPHLRALSFQRMGGWAEPAAGRHGHNICCHKRECGVAACLSSSEQHDAARQAPAWSPAYGSCTAFPAPASAVVHEHSQALV